MDRVAAFGVLLAEYFIEPRDNTVGILFEKRCYPNIEVLMSANGVARVECSFDKVPFIDIE